MGKIRQLVTALRKRSRASWTLATALVLGNALANNNNSSGPAERVRNALCNVYNNVLNNTGLVFAIVLIIVGWAGYMIYMGKREATDVIVKAVIATAIVLSATQLANWIVGSGSCSR
jgi:type IV secretory pathway VirB2 component (pilin)